MVPFPAPSPRPLLSVNTQSTSNPFDAPHLQQSLTTSPSLSSSLYPSALSFTSSSRSDAGAGQEGSSPTSSCQRIYSQLAVVKKLQEDMARSHALLEGIGRGSDWVWAAGAGGGSGDGGVNSEAGTDGKGSAKGKERSTGESEGGRSREKERRGLAYEDMKGEFQDRQGGVDVIMSKLSSLSSALKVLHALPSPVLFPRPTPLAPDASSTAALRRNESVGRRPGPPGRQRSTSSR